MGLGQFPFNEYIVNIPRDILSFIINDTRFLCVTLRWEPYITKETKKDDVNNECISMKRKSGNRNTMTFNGLTQSKIEIEIGKKS